MKLKEFCNSLERLRKIIEKQKRKIVKLKKEKEELTREITRLENQMDADRDYSTFLQQGGGFTG